MVNSSGNAHRLFKEFPLPPETERPEIKEAVSFV
jgi:hypothetical protein